MSDPFDMRPWIDCWQCGGEGYLSDCFDGFCEDAESGCDDCTYRCDVCEGKGGWHEPESTEPVMTEQQRHAER